MLLSVLTIATIGVIVGIAAINDRNSSSDLEEYIASNNPQNTYDIERLAQEFNSKNATRFI